ncbi:hypothetical protein AMS68_000929 [Peltaster fructicola]|uniref:GTP:AMP phosphotransferase, mitochondrial n=1 Tax=Peltaster fructicola TaxID=286661 RepID=A0A6H0XKZ2_9PEZI|nr:hypothetical protein AMS68_000929 [Peltaster fructicola]
MATYSANVQLRRAARIILVGAPGVGKGTQSSRLLDRFPQLSSISSGDLLRENVRNRTPLGIQAEQLMKTGALVPDSMILRLIRNTLVTRGWLQEKGTPRTITLNSMATDLSSSSASYPDDFLSTLPPRQDTEFDFTDHPDASFLLDGFPRNETQARQLDALVPINLVVDIHTPSDIIMNRICNRWIHAPSGRTYNTTFNPPRVPGKDDVTGEVLTQRDDDKPEIWQARLKQFEESSLPLLEHYDKQGVLWRVEGNSSDEISPALFSEFERRFGGSV